MTTKNIVKAPQSLEIQAAKWIKNRDKLLDESKTVVKVETNADLEISGGIQTSLKKHIKALSKHRLELTRPLDAAKKDIMSQEKAMVKELTAEADRIKKLNDTYATEQEKKRQAAIQAQREAEAAATIESESPSDSPFGNVSFDPEPTPIIPVPQKSRTENNKMVTRYDFSIIDQNAIPRQFLSVDESKIRAHINYQKSIGQEPCIPGVKFDKRVSVESR